MFGGSESHRDMRQNMFTHIERECVTAEWTGTFWEGVTIGAAIIAFSAIVPEVRSFSADGETGSGR
jgi:hypothetical protein